MIVPAHVLQIMIDKTIMLSMNTGEDFSFSIAGFDISRAIITKDLDLSVDHLVSVADHPVPAADPVPQGCSSALLFRTHQGMRIGLR